MKKSIPLAAAFIVITLPGLTLAAKGGKAQAKHPQQPSGDLADALKPFDKNGNHQIDADELAAVQKVFTALGKLDKNANGEIEQREVAAASAPARPGAPGGRLVKAAEGLKKVDKNGNHKIDADEIEALQKVLAGGRIMTRLDQNGNGKLEPGEVERLNQRIAQGAGGKTKRPSSPPPSVHKTPEKPTESAPPAETVKPAAPAEKPKTPVNFGS